MKKRFEEEKTASAAEHILINTALFALLFLSNITAQIPINGFCRYREFAIKPNYANIFPADFNADGFRDLLIYNPASSKYISLTSDQKSNFGAAAEKFSSSAVADFHLFGSETRGKRFLVLLRKSRQVGLASISKNGTVAVSKKIKFDGSPNKIDIGDIDGDGKPEGLVSGSSLDGLYILKERKNILKERKVVKGKVFSSSIFIDLDYDTFADIAAVDLLKNSIVLYYNNQFSNFTESHSIPLDGKISEFKAADFNSDGFTDLVYIKNNRFEVLLGDSVSSFKKKFTLDTPVKPDKYAILDFNGDGYNDVAYINKENGTLYISFAQSTSSFYPPILYMKKNDLADLTAFIDRSGKKLVTLGSDGKIYLINTIGINDDSFSIALGLKPTVVKTFDYLNDKYKEISFIDEDTRSLKLLLSERRNLFRTYFSIPLSAGFTNIAIDDSKERMKTFYLYTKGERTIELLRVNLDEQKYTKRILYSDGPIEDLKLSSERLKDRQTIFVLVNKNKKLLLQSFEFRDFRYTSSGVDSIASSAVGGVKSAALSLGVYREAYHINETDDGIQLVKSVFDRKVISKEILFDYKLNKNDAFNSYLVCFDENINRYKPTAALISLDKNSFFYFINKGRISKFSLTSRPAASAQLSYFVNKAENYVSFYFRDTEGKLKSLMIRNGDKSFTEKDLIESKEINNYFVVNLYGRRTFLIYSNNFQNTLTFEKI